VQYDDPPIWLHPRATLVGHRPWGIHAHLLPSFVEIGPENRLIERDRLNNRLMLHSVTGSARLLLQPGEAR